jgi:hypothetical protein
MDSSNFYHDHNKYNIKGRLEHSSSEYTEDQAISIQEDKDDDATQSKKESNKKLDSQAFSNTKPNE